MSKTTTAQEHGKMSKYDSTHDKHNRQDVGHGWERPRGEAPHVRTCLSRTYPQHSRSDAHVLPTSFFPCDPGQIVCV